METQKTLVKKFFLEPKYLDSNIRSHIYNKLQNTLQNNCTYEYGYIVDIDPSIKILRNNVARLDGSVLLDIEFRVTNLKPCKGQIVEGSVFMIFEHGIFITVQNKIKILIPVEHTGNYKYNKDENIFQNEDENTISLQDIITVKIDLVKYEHEKNEFNCIGILV